MSTDTVPFQISPEELKRRLDAGEKLSLVDVREDWEFAAANLGGRNIPLAELADRASSLDPAETYVVICHHGVRSAHAVAFLRSQGFARAINLAGGIDLWSQRVDPGVPRY
jgi:rhodanese-related sulfurtransferase